MGTAVISCCYAPPVFEPAEHVFDLMTLFVDGFAVPGRIVAALSWWDAGRYLLGFQRGSEFIAVISLVADQAGCAVWKCGVKQFGADVIA